MERMDTNEIVDTNETELTIPLGNQGLMPFVGNIAS
jgi:hypothetical protein